MTTDKYGPIDYEDQFFQAFMAGADRVGVHNTSEWGIWASYCEWLEDWLTEDEDA